MQRVVGIDVIMIYERVQSCKFYPKLCFVSSFTLTKREKEGDLTQSYDKIPYTDRKFENQRTIHKCHQKIQLHNDCGPT